MQLAIIRDGGEADLAGVAALRASSWDDTYRPLIGSDAIDRLLDLGDHRRAIEVMLRDGQALLLVAEDGDHQLAGFALSHVAKDGEPFLESLHVRPGRRGSGIGALLLAATAARWGENGYQSLSLHVLENNRRARRFYDRLGGELVGTFVSVWGGASVTSAIYRWSDLAQLNALAQPGRSI